MSSGAREEPAAGLIDLVTARALWVTRQEAARTAISAATRSLTEGKDTEPLRELAGASLDMNVHELGALIDASLVSLGSPLAALTREEALTVVARHFAKEVVQGRFPIREFADWAHSAIGHDGPPLTQDLVMLDDLYDGFEGGWGEEPNALPTLERFLDESQDLDQKWTRPRNP
ncbi:hypothetical protein [Arthrobacter agilis]|uniref:hypothetical protein n=1 Tax=Arthrobacter agilis TaxID=37921 RepID=UPI002782BB38|nr:hypothetical protein [Arthrobacter agilis]MDQ0734788.1 hypothetical protein [Arthrobacter agilis]